MECDLEIWLQYRGAVASRDQGESLVKKWGASLLELGPWWVLLDEQWRELQKTPPALLLERLDRGERAKRGGPTHVIRASRARGAKSTTSLVLRIGELRRRTEVAWTLRLALPEAIRGARARDLFLRMTAGIGADMGTLGPMRPLPPVAGWMTIGTGSPPEGRPSAVRLDTEGARWCASARYDLESPIEESDRQELARIEAWLRGEAAQAAAVSPVPQVKLAMPTYLLTPYKPPPDDKPPPAENQTQALPQPEEIKRLVAQAEPRAAMARAAMTAPVGGQPRDSEAVDAVGDTMEAPTPEEIKELIGRATPFQPSGSSGPPMGIDDYAVLSALRVARGDHDEGVRARYGTDSIQERAKLDLRMEQHFAAHPADRARYEERHSHFLRFLAQSDEERKK